VLVRFVDIGGNCRPSLFKISFHNNYITETLLK